VTFTSKAIYGLPAPHIPIRSKSRPPGRAHRGLNEVAASPTGK
jgi:hypothetical protein